jgi:hypothetical protein
VFTLDGNALIAPVSALLGTALGAWAVDHFAGKRWLAQQQWAARERYYADLLTNLRKAELSLHAQDEYYIEPGSEHRDLSDNERFQRLGHIADEALETVQQLAGPAGVFLPQAAIAALEKLARENWHAAFTASFPGEYIDSALPLVREAKRAVLEAATSQLFRSA